MSYHFFVGNAPQSCIQLSYVILVTHIQIQHCHIRKNIQHLTRFLLDYLDFWKKQCSSASQDSYSIFMIIFQMGLCKLYSLVVYLYIIHVELIRPFRIQGERWKID